MVMMMMKKESISCIKPGNSRSAKVGRVTNSLELKLKLDTATQQISCSWMMLELYKRRERKSLIRSVDGKIRLVAFVTL